MSDRRATLEALRATLQTRLHAYREHKTRALDRDADEQSLEIENDEVVERLDEEAFAELEQVDRALARIADGEGDRCEACGEAIDARRLQALPMATLCIDCAELER
ncbi:TraR/DksA family transcriptional regulator [Modicisalibacter tunisiensis]|uniref:TraR/DksA C4-type zinc finger protein n=1 Tax=Modicisalibacter tunisiensis TaxID=390637 RepID=A0ABS7WZ24_9GAMM|nr:TraR/DksA C4-type zinc finger protein [Modicisalibacter tunisiensis]MBZ9567889.1 TraR/DksA C4-type zinc finger protein [Modicisalibacter tunisiensis]